MNEQKQIQVKNIEDSYKKKISSAKTSKQRDQIELDYSVERFKKEGNPGVVFKPTIESFIKSYVLVRDQYWRGEISKKDRRDGINKVFENYGTLLVSLGVTTVHPPESFYSPYIDLLFEVEDNNFKPGDIYDTKSELYRRNCNETRPIGEQFCRNYAIKFQVGMERIDKQEITPIPYKNE